MVEPTLRADCQELVSRFYRHLDLREYEPLSLLFASEGVWLRQGKELRGPASVLAELARRPASMLTRHVVTNQIVDRIDAERLRSQCYVTLYYSDTGEAPKTPARMAGPACVFTYFDELRVIEGRLRITRKWSSMDFSAV